MGLAAVLLLLAAAAADAPTLHSVHVVHCQSGDYQESVDALARHLGVFDNVEFSTEYDLPSGIGRVVTMLCEGAFAAIFTLPPGWVEGGNGWRHALLRLVVLGAIMELRAWLATTAQYTVLVDGAVVYSTQDVPVDLNAQWERIKAKIGIDPVEPNTLRG
eukprot:TRINITY_DN50936_c0_g1_i1.p1 TRINITY_DN50936_c0_g1~~TRINITY_DN50936_c0_g1_i1.p1  ORF type:complete len:160 (+),score=47.08 TRINITY_DN50936_c0_g1_i1:59-538(+)